METNTIFLQMHDKHKIKLMINDVLPGVLLLILGANILFGGASGHKALAVINIIAGVAVLISFRRELKNLKKSDVQKHDYVSIFAGIVLILQSVNMFEPDNAFQPAYFYFLIGIFIVIKGVHPEKFARLRRIELRNNSCLIKPHAFRKITFAHSDVSEISFGEKTIAIKKKIGKNVKFRINILKNREEITAALKEWCRYHDVKIS